jgi:hypothetical protein
MRGNGVVVACFLILAVVVGCASSEVTEKKSYVGDEKIARPDRIIVYDFVSSPAHVPADSTLAGQYVEHETPQTHEEIETGRKLGAQVAQELAAKIQDMGLPAVRAAGQPAPKPGDLVIRGYFVSADEGSAGKRVLIGFGSGASALRTVVEGYQATSQGLRPLGSREIEAEGGKTPGVLVPLGMVAATGNPVGLIVGTAAHLIGETGSETLEGAAKRTAEEIAEELKGPFEKQGCI